MAKQQNKAAAPEKKENSAGVMDMHGVAALIRLGINAADERKGKNRIILFLCIALSFSLAWNAVQSLNRPEPKLLGETPDGRIRPLPLLNAPIFNAKEILGWAEKCVTSIYRLSYVDWERQIANETQCLSDKARQEFVGSLRKIGVFQYLNPEKQGTIYAVPGQPILKHSALGAGGYHQWVVEVPYRIAVDGKQRGSLEVVMTMRIRRVSLTLREDGIWVDEYVVAPKRAGGA
ncbi:DotI/IcmL family type IV secretion protein [Stutzerimonas stutzeri]|uniref:DotI/IcmL family type IV secretion protein n=1 Tax=Stutzerimonas stutzeri TaxID=316 RepID=UPI00265CB109|nr:DotI/IcmL family type IV secretion protein [Stutzerimonas stutzeri]MCF6783415.1 DotI/IcmL family type IV secretion protein [Stutzerimonas stutzeri]